jgi:LCP family protein required for cell wall assembly
MHRLLSPSEPSRSSAQAAVPSRPSRADAEPAATPAKRRRVLPIVLASVASTLVAVLAVATISIYRLDRGLTQNLDREDLLPLSSSTAPRPTKSQGAGEALNFVLMGYDSGDARVGSSISLMILHLNAKGDQAYVVAFSPDTWVAIPGHGNNKISAAYSLGGPKLTVSTLEKLTSTRMDHAALVDFQGFARVTDEVGGVTVYNKTAFSSHGFNYPKGNITVSGERALYFVGERRALPHGEFDRAANERSLVRAIIAKTLSAEILTNPGRLISVVSGVAKHLTIDKNLTNSKIRSTALSLRVTDKDVHMMKAPASGKATKNGQRVDVVDMAKLAELRTALRDDRVNEYLTKYPQG